MDFKSIQQSISGPTLLVLLLYSGYDVFGEARQREHEKEWEEAREQIELVFLGLRTRQIQQCLRNAKREDIPVTWIGCEDLLQRWQEGKPISGRQHDLLTGWAFGDFDPSDNDNGKGNVAGQEESEGESTENQTAAGVDPSPSVSEGGGSG